MTTKRATRRPDVTIRRASDGVEISADHVTKAPAKHTPGPWDLDIITDICMESNDLSEGGNQEIAVANARLIAAAPDLLAACKMALTEAEGWAHDQLDGTKQIGAALDALEPIRAAIRKAEVRP